MVGGVADANATACGDCEALAHAAAGADARPNAHSTGGANSVPGADDKPNAHSTGGANSVPDAHVPPGKYAVGHSQPARRGDRAALAYTTPDVDASSHSYCASGGITAADPHA